MTGVLEADGNSLEDLLLQNIATQGPHDRIFNGKSTPFVLMSEPKMNTNLFPEKAWAQLVTLLKEAYPEGKKGDMMIVGGIIDDWKFFYSKKEFLRLPQENISVLNEQGKLANNPEHLSGKLNRAGEFLRQIPQNVAVHYFLGFPDMNNMIELYNCKVDEFAKYVEGMHRSLDDTTKIISKIGGVMSDYDKQKLLKLGGVDLSYEEKRQRINAKYDELSKIPQQLKLREANIRRTQDEKALKRQKKRLEAIKENYDKGVKQRDKELQKLEKEYKQRHKLELDKLHEKCDKLLGAHLTTINLKKKSIDSYVDSISKLSQQRLPYLERFYQSVTGLGQLYNQVAGLVDGQIKAKKSSADFVTSLESLNDTLHQEKNKLTDEYHIGSKFSSKLTKRLIPLEFRQQMIMSIKQSYIDMLEKLGSEDGSKKLIVHPHKFNQLKLQGVDGDILFHVTGFGGLSSTPKSNYTTFLRRMYTELWSRLDSRSIEIGNEDVSYIIGDEQKTETPDFIIAGNHYFPTASFINQSNDRLEPTYLITLGPFFDVEKGRASHNIEFTTTDETRKAEREGSTSGLMIVDYNRWSPRFTPVTLNNIKLVNDTINSLHTSDIHVGKEDHQGDSFRAIGWLKIFDKSIESHDETGDRFQAINYRGSTTESRLRMIRTGDQIIKYHAIQYQGNEAIIQRSRLISPIRFIKGNHEDNIGLDYGIDITQDEVFWLNLPHLSKEQLENFLPYIMAAYRIGEAGYNTELDNLPYASHTLGHLGYYEFDLKAKDGKNYGRIINVHKAAVIAPGDKLSPAARSLGWLANVGVVDQYRNGANYRLVNQGHIHLPEIALIMNGLYVSTSPSLEAMNKEVDKPYCTLSSYGLKSGFPKPVPGLIKQYISTSENGPITFEFIHEVTLKRIYNERIKHEIKAVVEKYPAQLLDQLLG